MKYINLRQISRLFIFTLTLSVLPTALTFAEGLKDINSVSQKFTDLGNTFLQVLIGFAIIWIVFNVVRYLIVGADSEEKRKTAQQAIIWGVIGLAIILSIWGIVNVVIKTFVFDNNTAPTSQFPCIPTRTKPCTPGTAGGASGGGSGFNPSEPVRTDYDGNFGEDSADYYNSYEIERFIGQ